MIEHINRLFWEDVRNEVKAINPGLADIIDSISPDKEFPLYKVKYPYGAKVTEAGKFNLPTTKGKVVATDDPEVNEQAVKELLSIDSTIPVGIVLKNSFELYATIADRVLPWSLSCPGNIISLWRKLDPKPSFHPSQQFDLTSGARSIFMAPNVGDAFLHSKLKRDFGVKLPTPQTVLNQWSIFKEIIKNTKPKQPWLGEILFFPDKWITKAESDPAWIKLYTYFLKYAWKRSAYSRNRLFYNFAFSGARANKNLKPDPYLADTARHILDIGTGSVPGFRAAVDNISAPVDLLQKVYLESYGIRHHMPTIIQPGHFTTENNSPIYYSLQLPTTFECSPRARQGASTIHDLHEVTHIISTFMNELDKGKLHLDDTFVEQALKGVKFNYFHSKPDQSQEIELSEKLTEIDPSLTICSQHVKGRKFADGGQFFRCCVMVSKKD